MGAASYQERLVLVQLPVKGLQGPLHHDLNHSPTMEHTHGDQAGHGSIPHVHSGDLVELVVQHGQQDHDHNHGHGHDHDHGHDHQRGQR